MNVVFRTDASTTIGTGHVMRCLTLASALHDRGVDASFICRDHDNHLCDLIEEQGFNVSRLPAAKAETQTLDTSTHAAWLGVSWQKDAEQTRVAIESMSGQPDWLVVDHYALDKRWEGALRKTVGRIMVIDDLADRPHDCDLLLDQNLVAHMQTRYSDRVPDTCYRLLGSEYVLMQPIYAELHHRMLPREGPIRRIFVFFGGADSNNLTERALAAFLELKRPDIEIDVVIPEGSPHAKAIRMQTGEQGNIHLYSVLPTLAPLMAEADLAIGAGGATSWERLCLGLPTLVVTLAENQRAIAAELHQRGLIFWIGHHDVVDESKMVEALGGLIQKGLDENWSRRCLAIIDGRGVNRVCSALTLTPATHLRVRNASPADEAQLLDWANDPATRKNSFSQENIDPATHRIWFHRCLRDPDACRLYIVETNEGVAVGQVRFERKDLAWEVDYALAPVFRGRGIGRPLLEAALLEIHSIEPGGMVMGQVKNCNHPSRKVFESLDFEVQSKTGEAVVYSRLL